MADVTIAGRFDFGHNSTTTTVGTTATKVSTLAGASSGKTSDRLTLKGTENLGNGLTAGFEYTVNLTPADTSTTGFGGVREGFLTLGSSTMGTVKIGTQTNVFDGMVGNGWHNATGVSVSNAVFPSRTTSAINYKTPSFGGLVVGISTMSDKASVDGVNTVSAEVSGSIIDARYAAGPLSVNFGYGSGKIATKTVAKIGGYAGTAYTAVDIKQTSLKASYDVGFAQPYYMYGKGSIDNATQSAGLKSNEIGATFPVGAFTPYFAVSSAKGTGLLNTVKYNANAIGVDYTISKRTSAYLTTGTKKVKVAGVQEGKVKATAIGLVHTF